MERHVCTHCQREFGSASELARHRSELPGANQVPTEAAAGPVASAPTGTELTPHDGTRPPEGTGGLTTP
jgi:hypothetical protein